MKNHKVIKLFNIDAKTPVGVVKFQATWDVKYCYSLLKCYFEQELLQEFSSFNEARIQHSLGKPVKDITLFHEFTFDADFRAIEFAVLIGILETFHRVGGLSEEYTFVPAWQLPDQKPVMKLHSKEESWDGFIVGLPKKHGKETIAIPLELKSLMINPHKEVEGNPNIQLKNSLKKFCKSFQHEGCINCILVMPYSSEEKLEIDLKQAMDDLRSVASSKSAGIISMLTFPQSKDGKLTMSLLFALMPWDLDLISPLNIKDWMCQINFGEVNYSAVS